MVSEHLAESSSAPPDRPFRFTGSASEYFRIWIVNLCLSVLTLGFYAPWAKVRSRRYLYANLELDGSVFHYDADPVRILIGRLIVSAALIVYWVTEFISPVATGVLGVAYVLVFPLAAVRSTAFHHRHSLYRNVRFRFSASYLEALLVLVVGPLLTVLSLGLAYPWWQGLRQAFIARNSRFGTSAFEFTWRAAPYYGVWFRAAFLWLFCVLSILLAMALLMRAPFLLSSDGEAAAHWLVLGPAVILASLVLSYGLIESGITNLLYGQAQLDALRFRSKLRTLPLSWLYASNAVAVILSVGLLVPWARVRTLRHRAERLELLSGGDLDRFAQAVEAASGFDSVASEAAEAFDFDLGL